LLLPYLHTGRYTPVCDRYDTPKFERVNDEYVVLDELLDDDPIVVSVVTGVVVKVIDEPFDKYNPVLPKDVENADDGILYTVDALLIVTGDDTGDGDTITTGVELLLVNTSCCRTSSFLRS
jgi:hypothetical protein